LLTLIGGLYLWQAGEIAATRHRIGKLEEEHERWQRRNAELCKEITELAPVTALTERAQAMGFTLPQEEIYLELREGDIQLRTAD